MRNDKYYGGAEEAVKNPSNLDNIAWLEDSVSGFVSSYKALSKLTEAQKKRWMEEYPEMFEIISDYTQYENPMCFVTPTSRYENNYMVCEETNSKNYFDFDDPSVKFSTVKNNKAELSLEANDFFVDPTHGNYAIKDGADFMDNHYEKIGRY